MTYLVVDDESPCPACDGKGTVTEWIESRDDTYTVKKPCPVCHALGYALVPLADALGSLAEEAANG